MKLASVVGETTAARAQNQSATALRVISFGALLLTVTMSVTSSSLDISPIIPELYLFGSSAAFLAVLFDRQAGGLSLIVEFYFVFFVAVPSIVQINRSIFPFGAQYSASQIRSTFIVFATFQLAYLLGVLWARRSRGASQSRLPPLELARLLPAVRIGLAISLTFVALAGGPSSFLKPRSEVALLASDGLKHQFLLIARSASLLTIVMALGLIKLSARRQPATSRHVALLGTTFVTFILTNYPPALSRFELLGAALAISSIIFETHGTKFKVTFACAAPIFLLYAFAALKGIGVASTDRASTPPSVADYLTRVDFDSFKQVADTLIYVAQGGGRHGENFLGAMFFWLPKTVWAAKPSPTGEVVSRALGYQYTNVSSPLPAEAYVSFGWLGLLVVGIVAGYICARLERRTAPTRGMQVHPTHFIYALSVGFATITLRGSLNSVAPIFGSGFLIYGLLFLRPIQTNRIQKPLDRNQ